MRVEPNFKRLGIKKGLLHVYLSTGDINESIKEVAKMDGILSASVHVGNSDIVGDFVYEDSNQLIDTISKIKRLEGVDRVMWSEEVYSVPVDSENVISSFRKIWEKSNSGRKLSKNGNDKNIDGSKNGFNNFNHKTFRSKQKGKSRATRRYY
jgi:nitrate reductase NapAB chaperone NapD